MNGNQAIVEFLQYVEGLGAQGSAATSGSYHPDVIFVGCSDGRVFAPEVISGSPASWVGRQFLYPGPCLDITTMPAFRHWLVRTVARINKANRRCLVIVADHYSESSERLGCAAFGYDVPASRKTTARLTKQIQEAVGGPLVGVVHVSINTDTDTMSLCRWLDGGLIEASGDKGTVIDYIRAEYPTTDSLTVIYLADLLAENCRRTQSRILPGADLVHGEKVLLLTDCVNPPKGNWAFTVHTECGTENLLSAIELATEVLADNIKCGRIEDKEVALIVAIAANKSRDLVRAGKYAQLLTLTAREIIKCKAQDIGLAPEELTGVFDPEARKFVPIEW